MITPTNASMRVLHLEVLLMPNGEIVCGGKSLGFIETNGLQPFLRDCESITHIQLEEDFGTLEAEK